MSMQIRGLRPSPVAVLAGLALTVAMSGVAVAAMPGGDGTITACVSKGGKIEVIDAEAGETCSDSETAVKLASTDAAGKVANADKLDGKNSTDFLGATAKAADADKLDGRDSADFLGATAKAADADKLDGKDSADFLGASALPGKVSRHAVTREAAPGATRQVNAFCSPGAVAIGGGTHWGTGSGYALSESNTGIINASNLFGTTGWIGIGTNDENIAMDLTTWVLCANP